MQLKYPSKNAYDKIRGYLMWKKNRKGFIICKDDGGFFLININIFQYMSREREPSIHLVMEG